MKKGILLALLFLSCGLLSAQYSEDRHLDSLQVALANCKNDTDKADLLISMAQDIASRGSTRELGLDYGNKAIELEKRFGDKNKLALMYRKTGNIYFERFSNYEKALEYYFESLKLCQETNNKEAMAHCYNNIGNVYATKAGFSRNESDYKLALQYQVKGLKLRQELNLQGPIAGSYLNIGSTYLDMHNYDTAIFCFDKALDYYSMNVTDENGMMMSYTALSRAYLGKGDINKALEYIRLCIGYISTKTTPLQIILAQRAITDSYMILGEIYLRSGDYEKSLLYLQKALKQADMNKYTESTQEIYSVLSQLYSKKKDYKKAYDYQTLHVTLKDSLLNSQTSKNLDLMQMSYEADKKEKEIASLTKENEIKNLTLNEQQLDLRKRQTEIVALIIFALLVIISSAYINNRNKAKQREKLNVAMITQREMRSKAILDAEEKERTRIARDLHDSIGQMLSAAKLNVSQLDSVGEHKEEEKKLFDNALNLIDESCKELRNISHNMMPNTLVKSGLKVAVSEFLDKLGLLNKLEVHFEVLNLNERLDSNIEMILYRVIQESVNNILKHSGAGKITLQLIRRNNELSCMIEDNGKGFDAENMDQGKGIGLKNIYSRIAYLNGSVHIDSKPGRGTTINIEIPLA